MARRSMTTNVLDREALVAVITSILEDRDMADGDRRADMLAAYIAAFDGAASEIRRRFEAKQDGTGTARATCRLVDQLLRVMWDAAAYLYPAANPTAGERIAVVAVGGYGRGRLAPSSDIDLMFLIPYKLTPHSEQAIEHLLYMLWDMGLKVGHATRSLDDCVRLSLQDITIRTAVLEARFVCGDRRLFSTLRRRFGAKVVAQTGSDFVEAKLTERDRRHRRLGGSRYVLEPNIKDGKGGLRDLHTLYWIGTYLYRAGTAKKLANRKILNAKEVKRFEKAERFLWTLRCHLHYLAGRSEERLTFDVQPELARCMGYKDHAGTRAVERFMKHYFLVAKDVGSLTRIFCAVLEARHQRKAPKPTRHFGSTVEGFLLDSGRLNVATRDHFADRPVDLIRLFEVSGRTGTDIHPGALQQVTRSLRLIDAGLRESEEANRLFRSILTSREQPETTLRRMNEAGVLGRFIPDFGRVIAQMQYDMYHVYTTDEHTIFTVGILGQIERGELKDAHPLASEAMQKILSRDVLYAAMFLHDIAKGRGGNHPALGAEVAQRLCPRFGYTSEETETIAWLVRNHLVLSDTAFRRDLDDPKTVTDLVELVQSRERLRLLLCMTVADISAVGPGVWNEWKAALLRELYRRTEEIMSAGLDAASRDSRVDAIKHAVRADLAGWPDIGVEAHLDCAEASYWLAYDVGQLVRHARMMQEAESRDDRLGIEITVDAHRAVTGLTVYGVDRPGLFRRIAGALAAARANVVDAKVSTHKNGMVLDSFWFQNSQGEPYEDEMRLARLRKLIRRALSGDAEDWHPLPARAASMTRAPVFNVTPRVLIDNSASNTHTVIEVNGLDRPRLLYDLTDAITNEELQISSAKISTYGEQVVDVFYVKDGFGIKVEHPSRLARLRSALLTAMDDSAVAA